MVRHSLDSDGLTACWLVCTRSRVRRGCRVSPTVAQSQYRAAGSDPRGLSSIKVFNNELLVPTAVHGKHGNTADMILTIDPFDALERPAEGLRAFSRCDPHPLDDHVPFNVRRHRGCVQCASGTWCEKQCSL